MNRGGLYIVSWSGPGNPFWDGPPHPQAVAVVGALTMKLENEVFGRYRYSSFDPWKVLRGEAAYAQLNKRIDSILERGA